MATATLELFHHWADEAGWVLEVASPDGRRIALEGRVRTPALPGPSTLAVDYLDAPTMATVDGTRGALALTDDCALSCRANGDGTVHVTGTLVLQWSSTRSYALPIDVVAAIIT